MVVVTIPTNMYGKYHTDFEVSDMRNIDKLALCYQYQYCFHYFKPVLDMLLKAIRGSPMFNRTGQPQPTLPPLNTKSQCHNSPPKIFNFLIWRLWSWEMNCLMIVWKWHLIFFKWVKYFIIYFKLKNKYKTQSLGIDLCWNLHLYMHDASACTCLSHLSLIASRIIRKI